MSDLADNKMRIPLAIPGAKGFPDLVVEPHEFGDPYSVTITLPKSCKGKVSLPRSLLREMAGWGETVRRRQRPTRRTK